MINRYFSPPPLSSPIKGEGKSGEDSGVGYSRDKEIWCQPWG